MKTLIIATALILAGCQTNQARKDYGQDYSTECLVHKRCGEQAKPLHDPMADAEFIGQILDLFRK